jgi:hypothetical protein
MTVKQLNICVYNRIFLHCTDDGSQGNSEPKRDFLIIIKIYNLFRQNLQNFSSFFFFLYTYSFVREFILYIGLFCFWCRDAKKHPPLTYRKVRIMILSYRIIWFVKSDNLTKYKIYTNDEDLLIKTQGLG